MKTLFQLCSLVRSKNAGPFMLTFDAMFTDQAAFELAKNSGAITAESIAAIYQVDPAGVMVVYHPSAMALKISMPRPVFQSAPGDNDCYGGQQYVPLLDLVIA